jgi:hypothetical protein
MQSVQELQKGLASILKVDGAQRNAARGMLGVAQFAQNPQAINNLVEQQLAAITAKNVGILTSCLSELAAHDSDDAVRVICLVFSSPILVFKIAALGVLSSMSIPSAKKAIAKRTSFFSFASAEEKKVAKTLLAGGGPAEKVATGPKCVSCEKAVKSFPHAGGMFGGTVSDLSDMKLEADHAFRCESCQNLVCPVCSGKKASELGIREFVCPKCSHRPLKTIFRD